MVDGGGKLDDTIVTSEPLIIPPYQVPDRALWGITASLVVGFGMGSIRAFRKTGLRFLAENAHRAPTTVGGWYFYNKTKSYKQFSAGLLGGLKQSVKLGGMTLVWFALDDSMQETGARPVSNIVASLVLGGAFAAFREYTHVISGGSN